MNHPHKIIIAGAGGIARAAGLILMEWSKVPPSLYIGNRTLSRARDVANWIQEGTSKKCEVQSFSLSPGEVTTEMEEIFQKSDIILDCLPGGLAPEIAAMALDYNLHYVNLTEYVSETNEIIEMAKNAQTGFALQTGLAPGYINILAHSLYRDFCKDFDVEVAGKLEFKVGALTRHAVAPHFYGFTWSPVGVATEYLNDAVVIRNFRKTKLPALSERAIIIIDGITYEEDLTSGGAADLPDALEGKVNTLDYKTLRHPGHYSWVDEQIKKSGNEKAAVKSLQEKMQEVIPNIEDDQIVLYAAVEGKDAQGILRRREISKRILPQYVGKHLLRAIQTTTAVPMLQTAQMLLEEGRKGIILQSEIDPVKFLEGNFIKRVYGGNK
ncbi:saccharopine dehydrogenase [Antarcticibacterium arcticum]|uniref:Saccharopine dehydrogenase n=1 Tax=Antarcticibacterium arcticum TaxID=2585771 RepID=A0A5B8YGC6_9FLAO|nr:saccharopine dehydrogenase C-terminal domain-containing protein [Antarcticibacterium arcticum]QED36641.1 saccharopine dehydrogenase [Antarcticibacterium arcticum]